MLQTHRKDYRHCLLLTETIFSMDGDKAPLAQLADLANEYDTWLMSDDAHGVGLSAPQGEDIIMGTLSKSLGSYGGYICGSSTLINTLKSSARSLMFTTSLPAAVLAGALTSLSVMRENKALCEAPIKKSQYFTELLSIPIAESQIVPLMLGDAEKTLLASSKLEEEGFMVPAIRPPTVPEGMSRLRFSFSACHEDSDIEHLASIIKKEGWV
jgi:8-amino-7-oxononanoate synthase